MPPTVIELERIDELTREVFGPVLHVVRYRRDELPALVEKINNTGYGLTLGVHTRIDETIDFIVDRAQVGNQYVNRNMVGAVVGVQPFGGHGLSGTGPKAGGPLTLRRLLGSAPARARGKAIEAPHERLRALHALRLWLAAQSDSSELTHACDALEKISLIDLQMALPGPTGERNTYALLPREAVLSIADDRGDLLFQLAVILAVDSHVLWLDSTLTRGLRDELPANVRERIRLIDDERAGNFDAALIQSDEPSVRTWSRQFAQRTGPIVSLQAAAKGSRDASAFSLELLMIERTVSINTAAAGGNASLMTIG